MNSFTNLATLGGLSGLPTFSGGRLLLLMLLPLLLLLLSQLRLLLLLLPLLPLLPPLLLLFSATGTS